jgi:hypothetical protein
MAVGSKFLHPASREGMAEFRAPLFVCCLETKCVLHDGYDIRTVQGLVGHQDVEASVL